MSVVLLDVSGRAVSGGECGLSDDRVHRVSVRLPGARPRHQRAL